MPRWVDSCGARGAGRKLDLLTALLFLPPPHQQLNVPAIAVSARVEAELATLPPEEREAFLEELGLSAAETGLAPLVRTVYEALGLSTFFTAGACLPGQETEN